MGVPLSILLVDDNPEDRFLIARELRKEFSEVVFTEVFDPDGFYRALEKGDFDLVITDYKLYWTDGLEVLQAIKQRWPYRPVIMFTGTGNEEVAVEAMKAGLDDYIIKSPKHFVRLSMAVRSTLDRARERQALRNLETRYQDLFNGIPVGLFRVDSDGRIIEANAALAEMLGYEGPSSLFAVNMVGFFADEGDYHRWLSCLREEEVVHNYEARWRRRDGEVIWVKGNARLQPRGEGFLIEGYFNDISALKQAEEERERIRHQLFQAHKMEVLGRMVGGIAHDFNNLLTIIRGFSELLLHRLGESSPLWRAACQIKEAADRGANLTRQLLAFGRKQVLRLMQVNVNRLISEMEELLRRLLGEDVELVTELAEGIEPVKADPVQIEQVIMNLAVNARDAMPEGGKLTIRTEVVTLREEGPLEDTEARSGRFVCIVVSDTGVGMEQELLGQIFDPFFTTKEEGTGLGLSVAYGIVKQHGGWISVESRPGRGTTFKLYLPVYGREGEA